MSFLRLPFTIDHLPSLLTEGVPKIAQLVELRTFTISRCHEPEYERGRRVPEQQTITQSRNVVKEYMVYLNYSSSSPSTIFV